MHSTPPTPPSTWAPGMIIPGTSYRIVRPLGQGGMGEVYEAEHGLIGKRVAVKVLARELSGEVNLERRLRDEASALGRLSHPNLVAVFDLQIASDQRIFYVMELLDGLTLRDLLQDQGRLSPSPAVRVIAQALDGLAAAHSMQLVHRDIKPENVFYCRNGVTKLLDFGIAKAIDASTSVPPITRSGVMIGTPRYMAPEQAQALRVDLRADVYAAGLVLLEALAGRFPYPDLSPVDLIKAKLAGPPRVDPTIGAPVALVAAITRACSPDPGQRYSSADAFAAEIRSAVGEPPGPWAIAHMHRLAYDVPARTPSAHRSQPPAGATTEIMGSRSVPTVDERALGDQDTVPDPVLAELAQRIDAAHAVDRDAPTQASMERLVPATGPTGTAMLPAVAVQLAPTLAGEPLTGPGPASPVHGMTLPSRQAGPPQLVPPPPPDDHPESSQPSALAVVAAFVVPVAIAASIGLFVLRHDSAPSSQSPRAPVSAQPAAADSQAPVTPPSPGSGGVEPPQSAAAQATATAPGELPAAALSSRTEPRTLQPVAASTNSAPPAATTRTEPPALPTSTTPPSKKTVRPASGL